MSDEVKKNCGSCDAYDRLCRWCNARKTDWVPGAKPTDSHPCNSHYLGEQDGSKCLLYRRHNCSIRRLPSLLYCVFRRGHASPFICDVDKTKMKALVMVGNSNVRDYHMATYRLEQHD